MLKLDGIMTALVTPLNSDGTVDEQTLTALIDYQIATRYIVCCFWAAPVSTPP